MSCLGDRVPSEWQTNRPQEGRLVVVSAVGLPRNESEGFPVLFWLVGLVPYFENISPAAGRSA